MNVFTKYHLRHSGSTLLLILLLLIAIAVSGIGLSSYRTARAQLKAVDEQHTTLALAVPFDGEAITAKMYEDYVSIYGTTSDGSLLWTDGTTTYSSAYYYNQAESAPQVQRHVKNGLLAAYLQNGQGIASGSIDKTNFRKDLDQYTHCFSVLAVRCLEVTDISRPCQAYEGTPFPGMHDYIVKLEVIGTPSAMQDLTGVVVQIGASDGLCTPEGACPFEVDKTYLVRGFYADVRYERLVQQDGTAIWKQPEKELPGFQFTTGNISGANSALPGHDYYTTVGFLADSKEIGHAPNPEDDPDVWEDWATYLAIPKDSDQLPYYVEFAGEWKAFLDTADGDVWRDKIIPWTTLNQNSVQVVLTDNVMTTYNFNVGTASLLEGRHITAQEYTDGAAVCLISGSLAQANGWQVGDTVALDYYNMRISAFTTNYFEQLHAGDERSWHTHFDQIWQRFPLLAEDSIGLQKEYVIVGIYTAPEYEFGLQNFTAETVFVPKASVPDASQYENQKVDFCNALLLENGMQDDFDAYMTDLGFEGTFVYFDQGYSQLKEAYTALRGNALRLCGIGFISLLLTLAVSTLVQYRQLSPVVLGLRRMGVSPAAVVRMGLPVQLALAGAAALLGTGLAAALYGTFTQKLLGQAAALSVSGLLAGAALGFATQLLCGWLCLYTAICRKPIQLT